ncbi:MAG: type II toxin-antitoxin system VapB family antitoxin [Alphaproteobacteria bacterium]|nr:type II toxin-antitoxin system VapB family antitoxin [Alphaproteobacteria bacterium]MBF0356552.1 type II toxin-antitoxin system VapB family antitoxin [Alphaproteobacteria bacterium]
MRTNIEIDDRLMSQALKSSGCKSKKDTVHEGLKLLVRLARQKRIRAWRGRLLWEGDLDEARNDG